MQDNYEPSPEKDLLPDESAATGEIAVPETTQEPTVSLTQPIAENMEIHHAHIHHKKKWKDYVFEFFMLFLAVSSGFFVENLREHYVEHERAKEYAAMLRKDLTSDTIIMNILINFRTEQKSEFDSLHEMIENVPYTQINQHDFLRLSKLTGQYLHLIANNGTLQQLKSSGSLRYFTDTSLVYALTSYEEDLKHGDYVQEEEKVYCAEMVIPFKLKHFNHIFEAHPTPGAATLNFPESGLVNFDKQTTMEFSNLLDRCVAYNEMLGSSNYERYKKKAALILSMLEKEYHPD